MIIQKRLASQILKCSPKRIWIDPGSKDEIKEAITKIDIRSLIKKGLIKRKPVRSISRVRARKKAVQKRKGKQKGFGSRKGRKTARLPKKSEWMNRIRLQRLFLKRLRDKKIIDRGTYRELYLKSKGGFFRSKKHVKLYIDEHKLVK